MITFATVFRTVQNEISDCYQSSQVDGLLILVTVS